MYYIRHREGHKYELREEFIEECFKTIADVTKFSDPRWIAELYLEWASDTGRQGKETD